MGFNMLNKLNSLDILIGQCNYMLSKAEDSHNADLYNYWMVEKSRLLRERSELLGIKLGGV